MKNYLAMSDMSLSEMLVFVMLIMLVCNFMALRLAGRSIAIGQVPPQIFASVIKLHNDGQR